MTPDLNPVAPPSPEGTKFSNHGLNSDVAQATTKRCHWKHWPQKSLSLSFSNNVPPSMFASVEPAHSYFRCPPLGLPAFPGTRLLRPPRASHGLSYPLKAIPHTTFEFTFFDTEFPWAQYLRRHGMAAECARGERRGSPGRRASTKTCLSFQASTSHPNLSQKKERRQQEGRPADLAPQRQRSRA